MNCADNWPTWNVNVPVAVINKPERLCPLVPTGYTAVQVTLLPTRATLRPTDTVADSAALSMSVTGEGVVKATVPPG